MHQAIRLGLVAACHDVSEGGIAVAAVEMSIGGNRGCEINLGSVPRSGRITNDYAAAHSESLGRFLVEVTPGNRAQFEQTVAVYPVAMVGVVGNDDVITIRGLDGEPFIETNVAAVENAWRSHVGWGA